MDRLRRLLQVTEPQPNLCHLPLSHNSRPSTRLEMRQHRLLFLRLLPTLVASTIKRLSVSFNSYSFKTRKFLAGGDGSYSQPSFFDSQMQKPPGTANVDQSLSNLVGNMSLSQQPATSMYGQQPQWQMPTQQPQWQMPTQPPAQPFGTNPYAAPFQPPPQ